MYQPIFNEVTSAVFYFLVCFLIVFLAWQGEKKKNKKTILWAYVVLGLITVLRFDIGNDYVEYVNMVQEEVKLTSLGYSPIQQWLYNDYRPEFSFYFLSWFFSWLPHPYVAVIGIYGLIAIVLLYKSLNRYHGYHALGLLIYILSGIMFNSWDWVRQSVAFMIVLYSLQYIEERKPIKFFLTIIIGMLFHNSIILMLPFYFVTYLHINRYIIAGTLLLAIVMYFLGIFGDVLGDIMQYADLAEGYESYAKNQQALEQAESLSFKLRCLLYVFMWSALILLMPKKENVKKNLLFIGAVFFLIASGSQALQRISFYFLIACIPALPCAWQHLKLQKAAVFKTAIITLLITMSGLWVRDIITHNNRGCTPYDSILFENFANQKFRPKNY